MIREHGEKAADGARCSERRQRQVRCACCSGFPLLLMGDGVYEFEVFITPLCSCTVDDRVAVVDPECRPADTSSVSEGNKAHTELTTTLHNHDASFDEQIVEGFGISSIQRCAATTSSSRRRSEEKIRWTSSPRRSRCSTSSCATRTSTSMARARSHTM